ncbi:hypothetical protein D3C79_1051460 [compost metagenome]
MDIISELFGDWNKPLPIPSMAIHRPTSGMELPACSSANPIWATTITTSPAKVSSSDPILSESAPLSGATITIEMGNNISRNPA